MSEKKCFLITGGSGFIGSCLVPRLLEAGHSVTILTRHPNETAIKFNHEVTTISQLATLQAGDTFDVVINLAGEGIAEQRWSDTVKQKLCDSRIQTTHELVEFLQRTERKPAVLISGSAIGYYGLRGDELIDESDQGDDSFASQLCQAWEQAAQKAEVLGIRTCYLRIGVVLGKGGALARMLPLFKLGMGGPMGDGGHWVSWIHQNDLVGIIQYLISHETSQGPVNGTAPEPVNNKEFSKILGKVLNRPAFLPMPAFVIRLLFGEMGEELLLSGQRVIPVKIQAAGYEFKFPNLENALRDIV